MRVFTPTGQEPFNMAPVKQIKISLITDDHVGVIGEEGKDLFPTDNPHVVSEPFGRALIASNRAEEYDERKERARQRSREERAKAAEKAAAATAPAAPAKQ
jgi:hypothetical protein